MKLVSFGDSITAGVFLSPSQNWPAIYSQLSGIEVLNAGVGGNTTRDALLCLESDVLVRAPDVVVVEFGMNDPLLC